VNTHALIRASVRKILDTGHAYTWQRQGLGMLRLYLTPETRLHIWDTRLRVPDVSVVHDHPWDFRSYVVAGRIYNTRYEETSTGRACSRTRIRCGPAGCAIAEPEQARLSMLRHEVVVAGRWYEQRADEIHESAPDNGTVTLVERHFRSDTEHANVYHDTPTWVSAEPGPISWEKVEPIVRLALDRWDA